MDAEDRIRELEDRLEFAWACEAEARWQAAAEASLAAERTQDLETWLAAAHRSAARVQLLILCCGDVSMAVLTNGIALLKALTSTMQHPEDRHVTVNPI